MSKELLFESKSEKPEYYAGQKMSVEAVSKLTPMSLSKHSVTELNKPQSMLLNYVVQQVREGVIIRYSKTDFKRHIHSEQIEQVSLARQHTYTGELSTKGRKNIIKRINNWHKCLCVHNSKSATTNYAVKRHLVFITLTLCSVQFHNDTIVKEKMLKPFLRIMREKYGCENYVWKAETQKNGNIHFHIIIDKYVDKKLIQSTWNKIQDKKGYVESFYKKFGHVNPPSTKIEVVKSQDAMNVYMSKYIAKDDNSRKIAGAIWKMSSKLIGLKDFEYEEDFKTKLHQDKLIESGSVKVIENEGCEVLIPVNISLIEMLLPFTQAAQRAYYTDMYEYLYVYKEDMDFRTWMYVRYHTCNTDVYVTPVISRPTYPLPVQLDIPF